MSYDQFGNPRPEPMPPYQGPSPAYQQKNQEYANLSTFSRSPSVILNTISFILKFKSS